MRLNNRKRIPLFNFLLAVINVSLIIFLIVLLLEETDFALFGTLHGALAVLPAAALAVFLRGRQVFEYDSNSDNVIIKNRGVVPFVRTPIYVEIDKSKVTSFSVRGIFPRQLLLSVKKNRTVEKLSFDLSYLNQKEVHDLKISLHRILKNNAYR